MTRTSRIWIYVALALASYLAVIAVGLAFFRETPEQAREREARHAKYEADATERKEKIGTALETLERAGLIARIDCSSDRLYVYPVKWAGLNVDERGQVARAVALHCGNGHIRITSFQDGRDLATYNETFGYAPK